MPSGRPTHRLAPVAAVLAAAALFGTTGTAQALGPETTPLGLGAVRLAVGAAALALLALAEPARAAGATAPRRGRLRDHAGALLLGGVAVAAYQLCWFAGLRRTGVALGTIVGIGSGPVFAGLLHRARGRGLGRGWLLGTALTVVGVALLALRGAHGTPADAVGLAFTLGAGLSYAVYSETAQHAISRGVTPFAAMAGTFAAGALLLAPLLLREPLGWVASARGAALALHLGVLTIGVAYALYGWALAHLPVPTVVTLTLAEPLTAALLGTALLGERLGAAGVAGAAMVGAGLAVAALVDRAGS